MTATNKEIIEQAYGSFAAGDVPAALAAFADDIRWVEPDGYPIAGTYVGPQAVLESARACLAEEPGITLDYLALVDDETWEDADETTTVGRLLVAGRVGTTRLIDNMDVDLGTRSGLKA